ncbi:MAG: MFS transporter [Acidimicrobiia bacterium]|nr:MFS transporter [Acidimicrobiia bacterium]
MLFLDLVAYTALVPLLPDLQRDFGVSTLAIGVLVGVLAWGTLVLGLPMSAVTDRIGPRRVTLVGAGIAGVSLVAFGAATTFTGLLVARLIQGIASAAVWVAGPAWAAAGAAGDLRDRRTTGVTAAGMTGTVVGPGLGALLATPEQPLFAFTLLGWLIVAATIASLAATRRIGRTEPTRRPRLRDSTVVWGSPIFVIGAIATAAAALTNSSESVIIALGLGARDVPATTLGILFSIGGAGLAVTQAMSTRVLPGWAPERRAALALGMLGAVMALPAVIPTIGGLATTAVGLPLIGGLAYGFALALISRGAEETGSTVAVGLAYWTVLWSAGASIGPTLHGWTLSAGGETMAIIVAAAIPLALAPTVLRIAGGRLR